MKLAMNIGAKLLSIFKLNFFRKLILTIEHIVNREINSREISFKVDAIMITTT
jgi:hypothetical protein